MYNNIIANLLPQESTWKLKIFLARCFLHSGAVFFDG